MIWDGGAELGEGRVEFCDRPVFWKGLREPEEDLGFVDGVLNNQESVINARMVAKETESVRTIVRKAKARIR